MAVGSVSDSENWTLFYVFAVFSCGFDPAGAIGHLHHVSKVGLCLVQVVNFGNVVGDVRCRQYLCLYEMQSVILWLPNILVRFSTALNVGHSIRPYVIEGSS